MRRDCQRNWNQGRRDWNSTNFKRNWTLEKTEGAIKNGQSRETGVIGHTIRQAKQKQNKNNNTMCVRQDANKHN